MKMGLIIILMFIPIQLFALDIFGSNKFEGRFVTEGKEFLEDRFELRISENRFLLGLKYELAHPSDLNPITNLDSTSQGVTKKFISYTDDYLTIEAGDFYTSFGNGLVLDLYDKKELKIDKSLEGIHIKGRLPYLDLNIISGSAKWDRDAIIKGGEGNIRFGPLKTISSYINYNLIGEKGDVGSGGFEFIFKNLSLFGEYAEKHKYNSDIGYGRYAGGSFSMFKQNLFVEWKKYDRMVLRTERAQYNNLPWGLREPEWFLLGREVYLIDNNDEEGYRGLLTLNLPLKLQGEIDYAHSGNKSNTRGIDEYYLKLRREEELYSFQIVGNYQKREFESTTGVLEGTYNINEKLSVSSEIEYQRIKGFDDSNYYGSLELSAGGLGSIGLSSMRVGDDDGLLGFITIDATSNHQIRATFGKSIGGTICSGGVCRYVTPYKGIEIVMVSMF